jgi:thiopeptide-type bacteriocin biosynthesis protein
VNAQPQGWLYWKLYPSSGLALDATVRDVIPRILEAHGGALRRWFYIRFVDSGGPHIRFRSMSDLDTLDRVSNSEETFLSQLADLPRDHGASPFRGDVFDVWRGTRSTDPRIVAGVYEPEIRKWGTGPLRARSEELFEIASSEALRFISECPSARKTLRRAAQGAIVFTALREATFMSAEEYVGFLSTHAEWWSGAGHMPSRAALIADGAAASSSALHAATRDLKSDETSWSAARKLADGIAASLPAMSRTGKAPSYYLHHHAHLMLNRLGVSPPEEAAIAMALCQNERESDGDSRRSSIPTTLRAN